MILYDSLIALAIGTIVTVADVIALFGFSPSHSRRQLNWQALREPVPTLEIIPGTYPRQYRRI